MKIAGSGTPSIKKIILIIALFPLFTAGCANRNVMVAPAPSNASNWQDLGTATQPIGVKNWVQPHPGWLYVLDPEPAPNAVAGRIWLVDPTTAQVMGEIDTGFSPDFAISPDGGRLYVASKRNDIQSNIATIDTSKGAVLGSLVVDNRVVANGIPPYSSMAVSGDGVELRVDVTSPSSPVTDGFQLATFDTESGNLLPGRVHLGNCGYGRFIDSSGGDQFDFLCPTTNRTRRIQVDEKSSERGNSFVVLPWIRRIGVAQAYLSPDGQDLRIVRGDGAVYTMDVKDATFAPTPIRGDVQGRILPGAWPSSPDGSRIYLGYSESPNPRFYLDFDRSAVDSPRIAPSEELRVVDADTWRFVGRLRTREPFWSAVTTSDGKLLYALAPASHRILVIDTSSMREVRDFPVGGTPALALLAP